MRGLIRRSISMCILCSLAFVATMSAQSDAAKAFKANCVLCHAADGSGNNSMGKALQAKDLRSEEVQKQSDAALADAITKGKGKMPGFGSRLTPEDVKGLVGYVRSLKK